MKGLKKEEVKQKRLEKLREVPKNELLKAVKRLQKSQRAEEARAEVVHLGKERNNETKGFRSEKEVERIMKERERLKKGRAV